MLKPELQNKSKLLIIGGGIAGVTLAWTAYFNGIDFLLVSSNKLGPSASEVATGVYNPVTGKRIVKTWMADTIFPWMDQFYAKVEVELKEKIDTKKNILKLFDSIQEQNNWFGQSADIIYDSYLNLLKPEEINISKLKSSFGGLEVKQTGVLDCKKYIEKSILYFSNKGLFQSSEIDYTLFNLKNTIHFNDQKYDFAIFAEGYWVKKNPFFNYLPFTCCKGETITVKFDQEIESDYFIKKGAFLLPTDQKNIFKVGSSYVWNDLTTTLTDQSKKDLTEKLQSMVDMSFEIIDQEAAIRPTTKDRKPIVGKHPDNPQLVIFNGLGTKGVSLAPFFADHLLDHLLTDKELMFEVSISRFLL